MKAPKFWQDKTSIRAKLMTPVAKIYRGLAKVRSAFCRSYKAKIPVICVGNINVGGTGKTPVCLALGKLLSQAGRSYFYLNHGYQSRVQHVQVTPEHTPFMVGDEAMLLAAQAPTIVDRKRAKGAKLAERLGAPLLIMDDGFQNPGLKKDFSFVVVDGTYGFGNGRCLPSGPLREPIETGLKRANAVIIVGTDTWGVSAKVQEIAPNLPIFGGRFCPNANVMKALKNQSIVAFAGLGRPEKFFNMLTEAGLDVISTDVFPDHYTYTRFDWEALKEKAGDKTMVTTTKDAVKLPPEALKEVVVIDGDFVYDEPEKVLSALGALWRG